MQINVLSTPAEFEPLPRRDLSQRTCVVFDILRATSSMVTALAHGVKTIRPVGTIEEALDQKGKRPHALLAGERDGLRILADRTGSVDFDFGNSPREFLSEKLRGQQLITTTTNGTRALRACRKAGHVWVGAFLNLQATADAIRRSQSREILLVCSGTHEEASWEDLLGAGALVSRLRLKMKCELSDSALVAWQLYTAHAGNLAMAFRMGKNGARLQKIPALRKDLEFCAQLDLFPIVVRMTSRGNVERMETP